MQQALRYPIQLMALSGLSMIMEKYIQHHLIEIQKQDSISIPYMQQ